jgi:aspartate 4-decarboxylase
MNEASAIPVKFDPLQISPFTAKDLLVKHARDLLGPDAKLLDASRGGPNWQQRTVQCAWHVLGMYADYCHGGPRDHPTVRLLGSARDLNHQTHFARFVEAIGEERESWCIGTAYLQAAFKYLAAEILTEMPLGDIIATFAAAVSGGYYPTPAVLDFVTPVANRYLAYMLGDALLQEPYEVFLGNGATAVFGQVVNTMRRNGLLQASQKVIMIWPGYEPMKDLFSRQYQCEIVPLRRHRESDWAVDETDLAVLDDPQVRLVVAVSPGNPVDITLEPHLLDRLQHAAQDRPELVVLCDYVYANFMRQQFDNALLRMPRNVIPFYAPSKDFGLAGSRIGVAWIHSESPLNRLLHMMSPAASVDFDSLYTTRRPQHRPSFYERLVMDSSNVSFSHMAGLSTPNQILFTLCALYPLVHPADAQDYFDWVRTELAERMSLLYQGLGHDLGWRQRVSCSNYSTLLSLDEVARAQGPAIADAFADVELWRYLLHLAHSRGTIIMPGTSFGGEPKSVRVCLTSLSKSQSLQVGQNITDTISDYSLHKDCPHCKL